MENDINRIKQRFKLVGNSRLFTRTITKALRVSTTNISILITGESGTGKDAIPKIIHENSPRKHGQFIAVNCGAIPEGTIDSELFGHEKGAFTGAMEKRIGRFESANKGTLFLDEIGEIDASTQVKLLRFLESKSIERLGSAQTIDLNVRLVCATNRDLREMSEKGAFREDLFYRMNVVTVHLPPLREREEDISLLLHHFLKHFASENEFDVPSLNREALEVLEKYAWPGNIRELRNFCENLVVLKRGLEITPYDLDIRFSSTESSAQSVPVEGIVSSHLSVEENEKRLLRNALLESGGNRTKAAELMGISRRTLHRKLEKWPELDHK